MSDEKINRNIFFQYFFSLVKLAITEPGRGSDKWRKNKL